jgi:hypothetical protein
MRGVSTLQLVIGVVAVLILLIVLLRLLGADL